MVISLASANGGQAQEILKSPSWITWQPFRSISRKQSLRPRFCSTRSTSSSCNDSIRRVSQLPSSASSISTSLSCPIEPLLTLGGQSALMKTVWTSSSNKSSRRVGRVGWSPYFAISIDHGWHPRPFTLRTLVHQTGPVWRLSCFAAESKPRSTKMSRRKRAREHRSRWLGNPKPECLLLRTKQSIL